ncbi:Hypothetical predicted protein [Mytilus galloprovincialis]|uniref:Endonuclease/exonuclease/phosphatase domain-containing protein n=1 Tax=Mytilus galloprovincialis TaxID=29158 RepID=A0A8B6GAL1_MYTGA|nr:Hypothetical predicted protein [Mytilus galloprovincialis]
MSNIYTIPNGSPFYLCGDWNSRVSDIEDYIQGIDFLPERNVVDFTPNSYGDLFCEFLSNINCCILNGRNFINNDYTFVSTRGSSVVDYCVVPYEKLAFFQNFEVIRARTLIEENAAVGSYDPKHIPDHSLLCWTFVTPGNVVQQAVSEQLMTDNGNVKSVKYDTRSIPNDWMSDSETISKLNKFITELEESELNQLNLDNKYEVFVKIVQTEMDLKLNKRKTNIYDGKSNKRRRMKKSWWNENLTLLWNDVCKAERAWHKCHNGCKKDLRHIFVEKRKLFDKSSQKAKRQFWYNSQEQLLDDQKRDPREFWKKIGKVGVGNERQKSIPMEVTLDDGTTSTDTNTVLNKWKNCFDKLLNCNNQTIETNGNINISDDFLDREILFEEVVNAIAKSKNGKSPGIGQDVVL